MKTNFAPALQRVLAEEGGYSNHPRDPGGATNKGVIQRVYDGYRRGRGEAPRSVKLIADAEVTDIYRRQYWDKIQGDRLPPGIDLVVFDACVNSGPSQATKWLQRALGTVKVDGDLGEATVAAAIAHPDHCALIADICARRLGMLQNLSTWDVFGRGWSGRVTRVRTTGQAWASGSSAPAPVALLDGVMAKGYASDVALPPLPTELGTQVAAGGTGIAAVVQGAQQTVQPLVGTSDAINRIYIALTIATVVIAVGGAVYALWAARKTKQAQRAIDGDIVGMQGMPT